MRKDTAIFYNQRLPSTLLLGEERTSIVHAGDKPLIETTTSKYTNLNTQLLLTEQSNSVVARLGPVHRPSSFTPYGFTRTLESKVLLYFTGQLLQPATGHYLLGSRRGFNPVTMRFNSYDDLSPFKGGGINGYAYCSGDPVNREDPSGTIWGWISGDRGRSTSGISSRAGRRQQQPSLQPAPPARNPASRPFQNPTPRPANSDALPTTIENYNKLMHQLGNIDHAGVENSVLMSYIPPKELIKAIIQRPYYPHYDTMHQFYTRTDNYLLTNLKHLMEEDYGLRSRQAREIDESWTVLGWTSLVINQVRNF